MYVKQLPKQKQNEVNKMKVIDIIERISSYITVKLIDNHNTETVLSEYNGRDSIDEKYNNYNVAFISVSVNNELLLYVTEN